MDRPEDQVTGCPVTCRHALVVEEHTNDLGEVHEEPHPAFPLLIRRCLLCGRRHNRGAFLARLTETIRARHRVGPIPRDHWDSNLEDW